MAVSCANALVQPERVPRRLRARGHGRRACVRREFGWLGGGAECDLGNVSVRVAVVVSVSLLGLAVLTGCAPSRYEYGESERYRERESRAYFQEEERLARRRARAKMRAQAQARTKAKEERAKETARMQARSETSDEDVSKRSRATEKATEKPPVSTPVERSSQKTSAAPSVEATRSEPDGTAKPKPSESSDEAAREASKKQIEDGYRLLRAGFVKKARERFERAMSANAPEASLAQGRSMDPSYLKTVAFPDVIPDAEQARRMYRRAILLGNAEAKGDLERLEKAMAAAAPTVSSPTSPANAEPAGESPVRPQ